MLLFPGSHCAFRPSTAFASSFVRTSCSSSFPSPGNFARNVPRSNPGRTAISNCSVCITCGTVTISTFGTSSKWACSSPKASALSWFGVPRITTTFPQHFDNPNMIFRAWSTSLWLLPCQISARSNISPDTSASSGFSVSATCTISSRHFCVSRERRFTPSLSGPLKEPICQSPV